MTVDIVIVAYNRPGCLQKLFDSLADPEVDEVEQFENRFFAGHRLDIHFSRQLRIGFSETIIYGGPGRQIDLVYLNPIMAFHAAQLNEGINDNTLLGFDFSYTAARGVRFFPDNKQ